MGHMLDESTTNQLKNLVDAAQTISIIYPPTASLDQRATAASLYLSLSRVQKNVRLVTPKILSSDDNQVTGLENAQVDMGNQNLSMSFNYTPEQVDKVSYHIGEETGKFYLTIKPKSGFAPLDANSVEFSYTGASTDLLILVGVSDLESLEQLYFGYEDLYRDVAIVSINTYTTSFGTVKIDAGQASSLSEVTTQIVQALGLPLDSDTATNLMLGVESATQNLSSMTVSADTFETVANLLRAGARRSFKRATQSQPQSPLSRALQETPTRPVLPGEDRVLEEKPSQDRKNGKAQSQKQKKDTAAPPAEFSPARRM